MVRFTAPEFTALCPITGQPDFAHLVIDYVPDKWLVESKSLKLYLASFRNHGAFHEDCTVTIGKRLVALLKPKWLRIGGYWYPRGGMPIDVFWQTGTAAARACGCPIRASRPIAGVGGSALATDAYVARAGAACIGSKKDCGRSTRLLPRSFGGTARTCNKTAVLAAATKGKAPRRAISG